MGMDYGPYNFNISLFSSSSSKSKKGMYIGKSILKVFQRIINEEWTWDQCKSPQASNNQ